MAEQLVRQRWKIFLNPRFWVLVAMFAVCILLEYSQQILHTSAPSLLSPLGLTRHAIDRIVLLVPVCYATFVLGTVAGLVSLGVAALIMLPYVFLVSQYFADSLFETIGVLLIGGLVILFFDRYRKEKERRQAMLARVELADRQLQRVFQVTRRNEERLWALNQISYILSQSLELESILRSAAENIKQFMGLDAVLIFLLDEQSSDLKLTADIGVSSEYLDSVRTPKADQGLAGRVIRSGEIQFVENTIQNPGSITQADAREGICAEVIVPLKAKGVILGTLVGAMRSSRQFETEELDLLSTIGSQIGMAIENASCYLRVQVAAEQALASEHRYREIFENAHDAIWVHDLEGNIIAANKAAPALTGYSVEEAKNMNVKSFLTEESLALAGQIRQHLFTGEKVEQPYEQRIIRRDGTQAIVKLATSIVTEDGKIVGFQNIARDVTREIEMQDQLRTAYSELSESHRRLKESQEQLIQAEKLTSLGQLAASIAHEVNNPLSGILTYNQLLAKKIKSDSVEKEVALSYLAKMEAELVRSTKLIRNLLDFARQSPPAFRQVNLNDIVNRAYELTAHSAQLQHVESTKELDPSLPQFMADFDQLQQVCTNLILNAIQAMPKGGKLTISTATSDGQIKLAVKDTGVGISPENMSKLFTPFFTTKREVKGVGLGLAVSYGIVQRHHGHIEVQSKEGEGTTFTIYLPLVIEKKLEKVENVK